MCNIDARAQLACVLRPTFSIQLCSTAAHSVLGKGVYLLQAQAPELLFLHPKNERMTVNAGQQESLSRLHQSSEAFVQDPNSTLYLPHPRQRRVRTKPDVV
ncbi:hypothetical protein EMPS_11278 [Entomortierella parvispora]|uniref:Uncharacterized protein n=1 Tax=Entomortierella parvispora TaxID=205924 RepID=A0A9P3HLE4_9FUNG|nr:hypothetical protein EMPS_11278 [Entomortierella parvispora]